LVLFSGIILLRSLSFFSPNVINDSRFARCPRAIGAAEKLGVRLDSVTDNFASAIYADGREPVNRAFKTIKRMALARRNYFKRQVIIVAANLALSH
jgi:hypothetical protein